jgi:drug/metabolite transporter (DMT)-like permease
LTELIGEIAALATALCWSFTSIFFTIGSLRIGSVVVNRIRLALAAIFLIIAHVILTGEIIPFEAETYRWFWLGLSGLSGLVIGDAMLLQAFVLIGTRLSMLMMSLVPIIGAVLAWIFLNEVLSPIEIVAILITVGGITWVVADKNRDKTGVKGKQLVLGILLGFGGAAGQAVGLLTSKKGLEGDFSALSGNLIRMIVAASVMWLLTIIMGKAGATLAKFKDVQARRAIIGGVFFGPFIGVWLSLVAIKYARIGIASTLMALTPVILIPLVYWLFKERITIGALIGTIAAVAGVAILFIE